MDDRNPVEQIRHAVNARLSGLEGNPGLARRVIQAAKGEEKVKKRLSVGLVLVIVLLALAAVTALATALLWEQQVIPMKEIEQSEGEYMDWPINQKKVLIQALMDSGHIQESAETTLLFDDATDEAERHAAADRLVLALTGQTDVKEITVDIITYAIMGPSDTWTPEQRVWWQQVTKRFYGDINPDTLILPTEDVLSEQEAVAIAKQAAMEAWNDSEEVLENALVVADLYVTEQRPDYRRWSIQFQLRREDGYVERIRAVIVDEYGEVIADPDVSMPSVWELAENARTNQEAEASPIVQAYMKYMEQADSLPIQQWPIALKAAYSQEVRPMVQRALSSGEMKAYGADGVGPTEKSIIASTTYAYGLPAKADISFTDAQSRAEQRLFDAYGLETKSVVSVYPYYDITVPDNPRWKFVFYTDYDLEVMYRVELKARTGEIVVTESFPKGDVLQDLAYDLKWY